MKLKAVIFLRLLLVICVPQSSIAASGGAIGGDSFSSHSSSNDDSDSFSRITESVPYSPDGDANVTSSGGGGGGAVIMVLFLAFVVWIVFRSSSNRSRGSITVIKLQVGLVGTARSIQKELDKIAQVADTSRPKGLSYVLQESTLALLRHPNYCISAYSSVDTELNIEDGEKRFKQLSKEEREKFDEETLFNVNNIKRQSTSVDTMQDIDNGEKHFIGLSKKILIESHLSG